MQPSDAPIGTLVGNGMTATPNPGVTVAQSSAAEAQGFQPINVAPGTPISADSLSSPTNPLTIPGTSTAPATTPTATAPTNTTANANGTVTPNAPAAQPSSTDTQSWIRSTLASLGGALGTKGAVTDQLDAQAGVDQKTQDAATAYNNYTQAKLQLAQQIADIQANKGGADAAGVASMVADATRTGNANLANLSVISDMAQNNLTAAEKTVTDKVAAQFQPITDQIDFLTKFATVNNADLTDSQKTQITADADQLKTDSAAVQTALTDVHKTLMSANAPASVYSQLDAITEKYTSGEITSDEAQNQIDALASPYAKNLANTTQTVTNADGSKSVVTLDNQGNVVKTTNIGGGEGSGLTATEVSAGSTRSGMDETTFKALPADVQTFFARATEAQVGAVNTAIGNIQGGSDPTSEISTLESNGIPVSPAMQTYLKGLQTTAPAQGQSAWGKFWSWLTGGGGGGNNQTTPNVGDTQQYNGSTYTFDGTQWNLKQ